MTATGAVTGVTDIGILAYQVNSGNVTISAHTVTASADRGISVYMSRSGNTSGTVSTNITVMSDGSITSSSTGIYVFAENGTGVNTVISAFGSVTSNSADAIYVRQTSSGGGTVSISAGGQSNSEWPARCSYKS